MTNRHLEGPLAPPQQQFTPTDVPVTGTGRRAPAASPHPSAISARRSSAAMCGGTINGIPRVDPRARPAGWKRVMQRVVATRPGAAVHRTIAARLDTPIMKATGGRVTLAVGAVPVVVLTTTGARSGQRRETPLVYFTDGDDVILIASNYGGARHPGWYHNLRADPECELHLGRHGGRFVARETEGDERDRLFALAAELYPGYPKYAERTNRTIRMLRLAPAPE
jgi:deazaflavin-dependent oxidoreductase (nitroreductase family)